MHKLRAVTEMNNRRIPFYFSLPLGMFIFTILLFEPDFFYASVFVCMNVNWKK